MRSRHNRAGWESHSILTENIISLIFTSVDSTLVDAGGT